jgi:hypothetical protein
VHWFSRVGDAWRLPPGEARWRCGWPSKAVRPATSSRPTSTLVKNIDIFDFQLTPDEVAAIDALDIGVRGGPDPEAINPTTYPFKVEN